MGTKEIKAPSAGKIRWTARVRGSESAPASNWNGTEVWKQTWYFARERWAALLGREPGELDVEPDEQGAEHESDDCDSEG